MRIKIYRGSHEIGGTCIEIKSKSGKVLWIDIGLPLSDSNPDISYLNGNSPDAVIISHPHQDHYGLIEKMAEGTPVYIGHVSLDLINATKIFMGKPMLGLNFHLFKPWQKFIIEYTFTVTPLLVDHSSPEAFAFIIETDGKKIFYTGDFRASGRKKSLYEKLITSSPKGIDILFTEGTLVSRNRQKYPTEELVQAEIFKTINNQDNISFVISSAQNIDRFVSVLKACRDAKKKVIIDVYNAWVLEIVGKVSPNLPQIEWKEVQVYNHPNQLNKISDPEYADFVERCKKNKVTYDIFKKPSDFVYFMRCPNQKLVNKLKPLGTINIIYSQWEGYLKDPNKTYCSDILISLKNDPSVNFRSIHTSGHANIEELIELAQAIKPSKIVPIHTDNPVLLKEEFVRSGIDNVEIWNDNIEYNL